MKVTWGRVSRYSVLVSVLAALALSACGGGGGGGTGAAATYSIGGNVSGLAATDYIVLQDNNGDNLNLVGNGTFTFATKLNTGATYSVTVLAQPVGQACTVSTGAGTVSGNNVTNVAVVCSSKAFSVGGAIMGLAGSVTLQDNNGDNLTVAANGTFTFATSVAFGSPYSVTVLNQPAGQSCSVANGTGTMGTANVTSVGISCATNTYTIGGSVTGLNGSVVLQDNYGTGVEKLVVAVNGPFTFPTALAYGQSYFASIVAQPPAQFCTLANGSGAVTGAVGTLALSCANLFGAVQGTALPLAAAGTSTVSTFAGLSPMSGADGTGPLATFSRPQAAVADGAGNLYVVDTYNSTIRKIVIATGAVTTVAGQTSVTGAADGTGTAATFSLPGGIATDGASLYVADSYNNKIRKITPASGTLAAMTSANAVVTSLTGPAGTMGTPGAADSAVATAVSFNLPYGITFAGGNLYVADCANNKIRVVSAATGATSSLTGTANAYVASGAVDSATAAAVSFSRPRGIATDGANLYVADYVNLKIRTVVIATGATTSLTGTASTPGTPGAADASTGAGASFNGPVGIAISGGSLYVADTGNNKIRQVAIVGGATGSLTGAGNTPAQVGFADGLAASATLYSPYGIASDASGNLFVADTLNNSIRQISISGGQVSTLAGAGIAADGTGAAARLAHPDANTTDGVNIYVVHCGAGGGFAEIRKIEIATGFVTTLAGSATGTMGAADGIGTAATFSCPKGITTDGQSLYVADTANNQIRKIAPAGGLLSAMTSANAVVTTLAGSPWSTAGEADGAGTAATFAYPEGITTDGTSLYVADTNGNKIRKIFPSAGSLSAMTSANAVVISLTGPSATWAPAGSTDGAGSVATFNAPVGIATDGAALYVADSQNNKIRKIAPSSGTLGAMTGANAMVSSLTGAANAALVSGAADGAASGATFNMPSFVATDGVNLYVTDSWNNKVRMVAPPAGTPLSAATSANAMVSSVTGAPGAMSATGFADGAGSAAQFALPGGITTDGISLFVDDTYSGTLRQIK